jgi:hypothetical protein
MQEGKPCGCRGRTVSAGKDSTIADTRFASALFYAIVLFVLSSALRAQDVSLESIVRPSTVIVKNGQAVTFAIHGYVEFKSLAEAFPYIESQTHRWKGDPRITDAERQRLGQELLRRAVESRIVSMADERPLEVLVTHTADELKQALARVTEPVPAGYGESFFDVQNKWKHSLNCWSAAPSIPARVLSNWYPIAEGIELYGVSYDSTEHFWQAAKYHPEVTVGQLQALLGAFERRDWKPWLARLDDDPQVYLPNAYAVEFLRHNLTRQRLDWFRNELKAQGLAETENARQAQQRHGAAFRFSAHEEKVLWGDLADAFHLVYHFSTADDPLRAKLTAVHFDAVYLGNRRLGFISEEFRSLMLEIWNVKYLQLPRFGEVIASIPREVRLEHFLNDGDSPDIPIPVYVGYLNQIRELALLAQK